MHSPDLLRKSSSSSDSTAQFMEMACLEGTQTDGPRGDRSQRHTDRNVRAVGTRRMLRAVRKQFFVQFVFEFVEQFLLELFQQ